MLASNKYCTSLRFNSTGAFGRAQTLVVHLLYRIARFKLIYQRSGKSRIEFVISIRSHIMESNEDPPAQEDYNFKWSITSDQIPRGTTNIENIVTPTFPTGEKVGSPCQYSLELSCKDGDLSFALNLLKIQKRQRASPTQAYVSIRVECSTEDGLKICILATDSKTFLKQGNCIGFSKFRTITDIWKDVPEFRFPRYALKFQIRLTTFRNPHMIAKDMQEKSKHLKLKSSTVPNYVQYLDMKKLPEDAYLTEVTRLLEQAKEHKLKTLLEACFNRLTDIIEKMQGKEDPWFDQWWTMDQIQYLTRIYGANPRLREALHYYLYGNYKCYSYAEEEDSDTEDEDEEKPEVVLLDMITEKAVVDEPMEIEESAPAEVASIEDTEPVNEVNMQLDQQNMLKSARPYEPSGTSNYNLRRLDGIE